MNLLFMVLTPLEDTVGSYGIPISTLTPAGLLAVIIGLIAFGKLVPRRTMQDVINDRDEWRDAHRISEAARAETARSMEKLLEHAEVTDALLRAALPGPPGHGSPYRNISGPTDDSSTGGSS